MSCRPIRRSVLGATTVEFALALLVYLMLLLGIVDFARMIFTWNAASEITRYGARYAAVCDDTTKQAAVLAHMQELLPQVQAISVNWLPSSCTASTCQGVSVGITGLNYQWISPITGGLAPLIPMPQFTTYLPREVMRQDPNSNTICP